MMIETIIMPMNEKSLVLKNPSGTFIPKNDAIMVGIENTMVIPARNFMILFRLFDMMVA